jgi:hypothetical protein
MMAVSAIARVPVTLLRLARAANRAGWRSGTDLGRERSAALQPGAGRHPRTRLRGLLGAGVSAVSARGGGAVLTQAPVADGALAEESTLAFCSTRHVRAHAYTRNQRGNYFSVGRCWRFQPTPPRNFGHRAQDRAGQQTLVRSRSAQRVRSTNRLPRRSTNDSPSSKKKGGHRMRQFFRNLFHDSAEPQPLLPLINHRAELGAA